MFSEPSEIVDVVFEDLQSYHMGQIYDSRNDDRAVHARGCRLDYHRSSRSNYHGVGHAVNVLEIASLRELASAEAGGLVVLLQ